MNDFISKYYINDEEDEEDAPDDSIFTHLEKMHSACEGNGFYKSKVSHKFTRSEKVSKAKKLKKKAGKPKNRNSFDMQIVKRRSFLPPEKHSSDLTQKRANDEESNEEDELNDLIIPFTDS